MNCFYISTDNLEDLGFKRGDVFQKNKSYYTVFRNTFEHTFSEVGIECKSDLKYVCHVLVFLFDELISGHEDWICEIELISEERYFQIKGWYKKYIKY